MSPRIVAAKRCPHCKAKLPEPTPRMCPECAGSLQKRFLSLGCFTSAPPIVLALLGAAALVRAPSASGESGSARDEAAVSYAIVNDKPVSESELDLAAPRARTEATTSDARRSEARR